jgi:hypothetical protein
VQIYSVPCEWEGARSFGGSSGGTWFVNFRHCWTLRDVERFVLFCDILQAKEGGKQQKIHENNYLITFRPSVGVRVRDAGHPA